MNIDLRYQSKEINKEKKLRLLLLLYRFPIETDEDWFIDCYQLLLIIIGKDLSFGRSSALMLSVGIIDSFSHDIMQFFLLIKYLKKKH